MKISLSTLSYLFAFIGIIFVGYVVLHPPVALTPGFNCPDCNVIVIGVDTLRADHVHAFGYPLDTTPTIDALAAKGYSFTDAISASNWTVPSFMSIMTGVFPSVHKVTNKYSVFTPTTQTLTNLHTLSPSIQTLAQQMKNAGYATGGFTGDAGVSGKFGYNQGFDAYTDEKAFGGFDNSMPHALSWLDSLPKDKKFFMFFHGYDLHGQYDLPANERIFVPKDYTGPYTGSPAEEAKLREAILTPAGISLTPADVALWKGLYDSKVHAADAEIAAFLSELDKRGLLAHTVIVVIADHGEEFYEHGGIDHGQSLYDELVHVPLIIDIPGSQGGEVIPGQVSTMDIAPAILNIVGVRPTSAFASQTAGRPNLVSYLQNPATPGYDVYTETDYRDYTHERSIRTVDGWKYIITLESGKEQLYNLTTDPGETKNLIGVADDAQKAEELRVAVRNHMSNDLHVDPNAPVTTGCLPVYQGECQ